MFDLFFIKGAGEIDLSYFSPDCFHFNKKGQAAAALSLWNNMVIIIILVYLTAHQHISGHTAPRNNMML